MHSFNSLVDRRDRHNLLVVDERDNFITFVMDLCVCLSNFVMDIRDGRHVLVLNHACIYVFFRETTRQDRLTNGGSCVYTYIFFG